MIKVKDPNLNDRHSSHSKITLKLEKLVDVIVKPGKNSLAREKLTEYAQKILDSKIESRVMDMENVYMRVIKMIIKNNRHLKSASERDHLRRKIKEHFTKLDQMNKVTNLPSVLKVLMSLSQNKNLPVKPQWSQTNNTSIFCFPEASLFSNSKTELPYSEKSKKLEIERIELEEADVCRSVTNELFHLLLGEPNNYFVLTGSKDSKCLDARSEPERPSSPYYTMKVFLKLPRNFHSSISSLTDLAYRLKILRELKEKTPPSKTHTIVYQMISQNLTEVEVSIRGVRSKWKDSRNSSSIEVVSCFVEIEETVTALAVIEESIRSVEPTHCLSVLSIWRKIGGTKMKEISNLLFNEASKVMLGLCVDWMNTGSVSDKDHRESIVERNLSSGRKWEEDFVLSVDRVPKFMDLELADLIFQIGRIRHLKEKFYPNKDTQDIPTVLLDHFESDYNLEKQKIYLSKIFTSSSKYLLDLYIKKSELKTHMEFFKRAVLMAKGDFIDSLLTHLGPILDKPAEEVYYHEIMPIFDSCLQSSSLRKEGKKQKQLLGIKLMEPSNGDSGWDVFCVEYQVKPLNPVLRDP